MNWGLIADNLLTPPILFFALGMAGTLLRSDLEIPQALTRTLSLYLLFSIGMRGGVELGISGLSAEVLAPLGFGAFTSAAFPVVLFALLRRRLGVANAAGVAATYGSISAVTFVTACNYLEERGLGWSGHMVAAMALMESPAILAGVLLARLGGENGGRGGRGRWPELLREAFLGGPVFLLVGAFAIGLLVGEKGWESVAPFTHEPFKGILCLFLLDMGLIAARRLDEVKRSGLLLVSFAILVPLLQASVGVGAAWFLGLQPGDALLLTVLCASASYIAVPAALRTALPNANASLFLPMSLALTFPFNIAVGLPLYMATIETLWSTP